MGKSRDLSEFERGMVVGARRAGCSIGETFKLLGFSRTTVARVHKEWSQKQKTSSQRGHSGRKRVVDETGERIMEKVVEANDQATSEQIQALYNSSGPVKPVSVRTVRRTLKRLGYSRMPQQRDTPVQDGRNTLIRAGLDALAAYTSCPEQLDTSCPEQLDTSCSEQLDTSYPEQLDTSCSKQLDTSCSEQLDTSCPEQLDTSCPEQLDTSCSKQLDTSCSEQLDTSCSEQLDTSYPEQLDTSCPEQLDTSCSEQLDTSYPEQLDTSSPEQLDTSTDNDNDPA